MSTAIIKNPDDIQCTLQFTMSLKDWKQIRKTLKVNPAHTEMQIMSEISDLVYQLENTLYVENKEQ